VVTPPALKPGDTIGIVAPASNIRADWLAAGIAELERLGFRVKHRPDIFEKHHYTAGSLERRLSEFHDIWFDPEVDAVMAARGGYGAIHLLPHLDVARLREQPKVFIGYSDITALHLFLAKECDLVTFHGPLASKDFTGGPDHYDEDSFRRVTGRAEPAGILTSPHTETLVGGQATGRLVGGCLPLITALNGTPWQLDTRDSILFLEDIGTKPYQIDRMITQLNLSGMLASVRAVIFGEMADCIQNVNQGYTLQEILTDLLRPLGIPVVYGWRSGHSETGNRTLPLGVRATLDADAMTLDILEKAVS
jgi:muramoyltetrapeptide carboxypeptidase